MHRTWKNKNKQKKGKWKVSKLKEFVSPDLGHSLVKSIVQVLQETQNVTTVMHCWLEKILTRWGSQSVYSYSFCMSF